MSEPLGFSLAHSGSPSLQASVRANISSSERPFSAFWRALPREMLPAASLGCNSLAPQDPSEAEEPRCKVPRLVPRLDRQAPLLLEICAGSAILSSTASQHGWDVIPVDQASCPLVVLDLRDPSSLDVLLRFDGASPADWIHLGLPCGTCSRARERPLPGKHGARPLRGPDALFGLPGLRPFEAEQVAAANAVYRACIRILFRAYETGALISIENPVRSRLWPLLACLVKAFDHAAFTDWFFALTDYDFDACMFGSRRAKAARIKGTPGIFKGLQLPCDQSHTHLSWRPFQVAGRWVYPTKEEAEYPPQLCAFLCKKAGAALATKAASLPAYKRAQLLRAEVRASAQHQHVAMPPLIPEFRCTMQYKDVPKQCDVKLLMPADSSSAGVKSDPSALSKAGMKYGPSVSSAKQRLPVKPDDVVGVYYTMEEHLEMAKGLPCPGDCSHRLPDPLRKNLFLILTEGPVAVSKMRLQALREVNELAAKLAEEEKTLRSSMHPEVDAVTKGKSISVFRALLEETKFPDMSVVDLLVSGVPLVGDEQPSALFSKRPKIGDSVCPKEGSPASHAR